MEVREPAVWSRFSRRSKSVVSNLYYYAIQKSWKKNNCEAMATERKKKWSHWFFKIIFEQMFIIVFDMRKSGLGSENNPERGLDSQRDDELLQGLVVLLQVSVTRRPANNPIAKTTF